MNLTSSYGLIGIFTLLLIVIVNIVQATYPISSETLGELAIPALLYKSAFGFKTAGRISGKLLAGSLHFSQINLNPPPKQYLPLSTLKGPHVKDGHPEHLKISPNPSYPSTVREIPNYYKEPNPLVTPIVLNREKAIEQAFSIVNGDRWQKSLYPYLPSKLL